RHFLSSYPRLVSRCRVLVKEDTWKRVDTIDSTGKMRAHDHAFVKAGPHFMYGRSEGTRGADGLLNIAVFGGVKNFTLFKTTQSSFTNFHVDNNTSLPEATDRL
ncbi:unnamed protein product, partial [Sphacelaria rigidula]